MEFAESFGHAYLGRYQMRVFGRTSLRQRLTLFFAVSTLVAMMAPSALGAGGTFTDDDDSIFEPDIEWLADAGITAGCNPPVNDNYCPNNNVTRGQMAAFLVRAMGYTSDGGGDLFVDDDDSIFEGDIDRLATAGVTRGCNPPDNNMFCPTSYVTRGQMAAFLVRAMGYTDDGGGDLFLDDDSSIFEADIDRLATAGVTRGCNPPDNDNFCPNSYVTRGQMAAFLHRALGGTAPPPGGSGDIAVTGKIVDAGGSPVAGATVTVTSDPIVVTTDAAGEWSTTVGPGAHTLSATKNGTPLGSMCFVGVETVRHDLGVIGPNTDDECRTPYPTATDSDGDGLSNADETAGWTITLHLADGSTQTRKATSDPNTPDTDSDGLWDDVERSFKTDPRRWDTDADRLSDYAEKEVFGSNPANEDSDGDACPATGTCVPAPKMFDGNELLSAGTSPTDVDTDGDYIGDYEELTSGGRNPLVSDLPEIALEFDGDASIELDASIASDCTTGTATLEQDTAGYERYDAESTKMSIDNTVDVHSEVEAGTDNWPPSANVKIETDTTFKHSYATESSSAWTQSSVEDTQTWSECVNSTTVKFENGVIRSGLRIRNLSDMAIELADLTVHARRIKPGGTFETVGLLTASDDLITIGPLSSALTEVKNKPGEISASPMERLASNPTGLTLEISKVEMSRLEPPITHALLSQSVIEQTGTIVIDYGDGSVEHHAVATNVYRNADGLARGTTLEEAMDVLGLDYTTSLDRNGVQTLYSLEGIAAFEACGIQVCPMGLWIIGSTERTFDTTTDFEEIVLNQGEMINLTYVQDTDGDGLLDREEYLLGSDETAVDTDGDTLSDYEEAHEGWDVGVVPAYTVYSDPRFDNIDYGTPDGYVGPGATPPTERDAWTDSQEKANGTDPYRWDTDGDGAVDNVDLNPLMAPCVAASADSLTAWWDGTEAPVGYAADVWPDDGFASNGDLVGNATVVTAVGPPDLVSEDVFRLNPENLSDGSIEVVDDSSLTPHDQFTWAGWVLWSGPRSGETWQNVVLKGPSWAAATYGIIISNTGELRGTIRRRAREVCTASPNDSDLLDQETVSAAGVIEQPGVWTYVALRMTPTRLALFVDGAKVAETSMDRKIDPGGWWAGHCRRYTKYLEPTTEPLLIGGAAGGHGSYKGLLDDFMLFPVERTDDELVTLGEGGICPIP